MNRQLPPPGERAGDELVGAAAVAALQDVFTATFGTRPRITLSVRGLATRRCGDRVRVQVTFTDGSIAELDIRASRVKRLRDQLSTVLEP